MRKKVAVATVDGRAYYLIVNELKESNISFLSLVPGQQMPAQVKVVITTEKEKTKINNGKIIIFHESGLDILIYEVKRSLEGKEAYRKVIIGLDPGKVTGLVVLADGKVLEEGNCFSKQEIVKCLARILKDVNYCTTDVYVKIGNGGAYYREILDTLDSALPNEVFLEVVTEHGTNKPLIKRSRRVRHISSANRIAARTGNAYSRNKTIPVRNEA